MASSVVTQDGPVSMHDRPTTSVLSARSVVQRTPRAVFPAIWRNLTILTSVSSVTVAMFGNTKGYRYPFVCLSSNTADEPQFEGSMVTLTHE